MNERGFTEKYNKLSKRSAKRSVYTRFCPVGTKEAGAGALVATANRNCDFRGGRLGGVAGTKVYFLHYDDVATIPKIPATYGKALRFFTLQWKNSSGVKKDSIGALAENQKMFIYDLDLDAFKMISSAANLVTVRNFYDSSDHERLLFCAAKEAYAYDLVNLKKWIFKTTPLSAACVFHERVFFASEHTLKYSAPMIYDNFTESIEAGGSVRLNSDLGEIVGLEPLGECIYIIRQFGIMKLEGGGAANDFTVEVLPYKGEQVIGSSICVCGDRIFFLAYDGLYAFDGKNVEAIGRGLDLRPLRAEQFCAPGYFDGKFHLTFTDEAGEKRTVFVDLREEGNFGETFVMHGLSVSHGRAIVDNDRAISYLDPSGDLPTGEEYSFDVSGADFGVAGEKLLRSVELCGEGNCSLTVVGRNGSKKVDFALGDGKTAKKFCLKGGEFDLAIRLQKGCVIDSLAVDFEKIG